MERDHQFIYTPSIHCFIADRKRTRRLLFVCFNVRYWSRISHSRSTRKKNHEYIWWRSQSTDRNSRPCPSSIMQQTTVNSAAAAAEWERRHNANASKKKAKQLWILHFFHSAWKCISWCGTNAVLECIFMQNSHSSAIVVFFCIECLYKTQFQAGTAFPSMTLEVRCNNVRSRVWVGFPLGIHSRDGNKDAAWNHDWYSMTHDSRLYVSWNMALGSRLSV